MLRRRLRARHRSRRSRHLDRLRPGGLGHRHARDPEREPQRELHLHGRRRVQPAHRARVRVPHRLDQPARLGGLRVPGRVPQPEPGRAHARRPRHRHAGPGPGRPDPGELHVDLRAAADGRRARGDPRRRAGGHARTPASRRGCSTRSSPSTRTSPTSPSSARSTPTATSRAASRRHLHEPGRLRVGPRRDRGRPAHVLRARDRLRGQRRSADDLHVGAPGRQRRLHRRPRLHAGDRRPAGRPGDGRPDLEHLGGDQLRGERRRRPVLVPLRQPRPGRLLPVRVAVPGRARVRRRHGVPGAAACRATTCSRSSASPRRSAPRPSSSPRSTSGRSSIRSTPCRRTPPSSAPRSRPT